MSIFPLKYERKKKKACTSKYNKQFTMEKHTVENFLLLLYNLFQKHINDEEKFSAIYKALLQACSNSNKEG